MATSPRQRILAAARDLFYRQGIRAVGVDAIAEAAGTNKMTLYRHFHSKDELVAAYLRELVAEHDAQWEDEARQHAGAPRRQLLTWLRDIGQCVTSSGGQRGCPLANAAVELPDPDHPARAVIEQHKRDERERLVGLCRDAGVGDPERTADRIVLMIEGARVSLQSVGGSGPGSRLVALLEGLVTAEDGAGARRAAPRRAAAPRPRSRRAQPR